MFKDSFLKVLEGTEAKKIIIVGAGKYGRELAGALIDHERDVKCFFDKKDVLQGLVI